MFGLSAFYPGRTATVTYQLMDCPEGMDNDDQEFVQVEFELSQDIYELAARAARRRGMGARGLSLGSGLLRHPGNSAAMAQNWP
jgi:hypothetical protein